MYAEHYFRQDEIENYFAGHLGDTDEYKCNVELSEDGCTLYVQIKFIETSRLVSKERPAIAVKFALRSDQNACFELVNPSVWTCCARFAYKAQIDDAFSILRAVNHNLHRACAESAMSQEGIY